MSEILTLLEGSDRRSKGNADQATRLVLEQNDLIDQVIAGLSSDNLILEIRSAVVLRQVSLVNPELIEPFEKIVIKVANISLVDSSALGTSTLVGLTTGSTEAMFGEANDCASLLLVLFAITYFLLINCYINK